MEEPSSQTAAPKHPIQVVARRTGLSQDVIRAWERRYQAVLPQRSATSRRLYSDHDVERLILLQRTILAGRRIGDVAQLSIDELSKLVLNDESASPTSRSSSRPSTGYVMELFEDCVEAVHAMNPTVLYTTLSSAAISLSPVYLMEELLGPLLNQILDECRSGALRRCQEQMATTVIRSFLLSLIASTPRTAGSSRVIAATLPGQVQEWAALMQAVAANAEGWEAIYLGSEIAPDELAFAFSETRARAALIGISHPSEDPHLPNELRKLRSLLPEGAAIIVAGPAAITYQEVLREISAQRLQGPGELRLELERLTGSEYR
jgi:MerR family transcriptional regulator, light-induced transcriptional regulator